MITLNIPDGMRIGKAMYAVAFDSLKNKGIKQFNLDDVARELSEIEDQDLLTLLSKL